MNNNPSKRLPLTLFVTGADIHHSKMAVPLLVYLYNDMKVDFNYVISDSDTIHNIFTGGFPFSVANLLSKLIQ